MRSRRFIRRIGAWIFPARASTMTWMLLTFALFVGVAVAAVGLYVLFVLQDEVDAATGRMLYQQAERVAWHIEQAPSAEARTEAIRTVGSLNGMQVAVLSPDTVLGDPALAAELQEDQATVRAGAAPPVGALRISRRDMPVGSDMLYVSVYRPGSDLLVGVAQPEPSLLDLIRRMQAGLIVGMVMALLLAMMGSWVAAHQVTRPLQTIRNSARSISEGKFDERITVDSRASEFHELAANLNRMSGSFRKQIEELQRMARIQNEFIGNVSHEVRNPIFAVGGYLEALASPLSDEQRKRYAEKGLANLQRLNNLFSDLIEIARLEYREDLIQSKTFDLGALVDEISEMLRPKAEEKGLGLETANPHINVSADRNRIRQVLTNLIDNAIAYTDEGTVRCRFRRRLDKVRIEVVDTGRGIPEDHLERVFERFYRVDPDRSRRSGGTGLGLSIVKQILHAHGEQIHVESTVGRGTRFWFELPYAGLPAEIEQA
jgi:signal transduction histidine kinase